MMQEYSRITDHCGCPCSANSDKINRQTSKNNTGPQWHPPVDRALMDISCIATPAWEEEELKEKYQDLLKKTLREPEKELRNMKHQRGLDTTDTNGINALYDQLTKGIIKAAEQCLPRRSPHP